MNLAFYMHDKQKRKASDNSISKGSQRGSDLNRASKFPIHVTQMNQTFNGTK
jgi:hypothetical protein